VKTRTALGVLSGALLLAVVTDLAIQLWFHEWQKSFYAQQQQLTTEELRQWAREDKDQKNQNPPGHASTGARTSPKPANGLGRSRGGRV
jgi:hypothetical protein